MAAPDVAARMGSIGREIVQHEFRFRDYVYDLATFGGIELPKISVVVPDYHYGHPFYARLGTIAAQNIPVHELIVLDDASTDDSVTVINGFAERALIPIQLIVNETNSGSVFHQWRKGVEVATGGLIWIVEADDLSDRNFLR
ncbi:MAG: glycosyltransferase [Candidatus Saccharibacteria bacterium]|nr:glycosyltransferase [Microbacteriaceae bacterium]